MTSGLLSNYCYGITVDNYSSVWVTHKIGLSEKKAAEKIGIAFLGIRIGERGFRRRQARIGAYQ